MRKRVKYINEIREGENLHDVYFCKSKQALKTKAGKTYYSVMLQDKTGTLDAKIWSLTAGIEDFESLDYIYVEGQVTSFQGMLQLNISRVRKLSEGEYNISDYMPVTSKNIDEMTASLKNIINQISHPKLKQLLSSFFIEDEDFMKRFANHSAAKSVHHGFIGGLLEHTLGVTNLCIYMKDHYPMIHGDLLITAAIFHDIGKLEEISSFPENDYTDDGQLMGHIFIGANQVSERIKTIPDFPKKLASELVHCILAHHGELEYGSPKKPALIEALALNFADNTDAKLQTMLEVLNSGDEKSEWLGYQRLFESNVRRSSI